MLITKLKLNYFGRFHNREIELKPGINLIYGENEAGKSTIHTFIKGMLFGIDRLRGRGAASKEDLYTKYLPWEYPGAFGGSMDLRIGDKEYRLIRSFHASDKNFTVLDLSNGREIKLQEGHINELIQGLTESSFRNTISIGQLKAQTDQELAIEVRNYIANLSISKSREVNVAKAINILNVQKKALEASQNTSEIKNLQAEIEEGILREEKIDALTLQLKDLLSTEQELREKKDSITASQNSEEVLRIEQLPAILEKYRTYQELSRQILLSEKQSTELKESMYRWETEKLIADALKDDIKRVERLHAILYEKESKKADLFREMEKDLLTTQKKNAAISFIPAGIISLLSVVLTDIKMLGIIIAVIALSAGGLVYRLLKNKENEKQKIYQVKVNEIEQQLSAAKAEIEDILHKYQTGTVEGLYRKQEEFLKNGYAFEHSRELLSDIEHRKSEAEDQLDFLYDSIMKYLRYYVSEEELSESSIQKLQENINRRKQEEVQKLAEVNRLYEDVKLRMEKLKWEIKTIEGNEAKLLLNKETLTQMEEKQKEDATELAAIKLALNTIEELSIDIHDSFGRQLNTAVSEIIGEVTNEKYTDIKVDEKLDVKIGWNGDYIALDRLSAGTMDQVYFSLRLAVAELLLGKEEFPLFLDDSFALYDDNRVKAALKKVSTRQQVVLFSCHKREQSLLRELNMPYHYVDLTLEN